MGHGPFSHAFQEWIEEAAADKGLHFVHEDMSLSLLRLIVEKYKLGLAEEEVDLGMPMGYSKWIVLNSFIYIYISWKVACMISSDFRLKKSEFLATILPEKKKFMIHIVCNSINSIDVDKFDVRLDWT